ncbi:hypothetical protein P5673_020881 [Acropora cervicornis]|uniref:SAP domain-containing protein n=1 Tax=Acropora cervicornis TaxID=6130 RepID=A0AAD9V164_ACRCE|nr:hypothetical protein P5673_020881 [Acropora cervicornis]
MVAYAIPYHASLLFNNYDIGFGILSLQLKESKHSGIKHDLFLTNCSRSTGSLGKWWQVMRANYVKAFYLPEDHPMPSMYVSHYESRMPSQGTQSSQHLTPKELSVAQLKKELKNRGLSTTGNKDILSRSLEGCLASQV